MNFPQPVSLMLKDHVIFVDVIVNSDGQKVWLEGELTSLLDEAGKHGSILYFTEYLTYGIPLVCLQDPDKAAFYWMMADFDEPETGLMRDLEWSLKQTMIAPMTAADFIAWRLNKAIGKRMVEEPELEEGSDEDIIYLMGQMFIELIADPDADAVEGMAAVPHELAYEGYQHDGSLLRIDANGYHSLAGGRCSVLEPPTPERYGIFRPQVVQDPDACSRGWIQ